MNTGFQLSSININGIVAPNIVMADGAGTANFVQYGTQAQGFIPISAGTAVPTFAGSTVTSIVDVTGLGAQNFGGATNAVYAVRTDGDITNGTLRIQSISNTNMGGLLLNGANQNISANLVFGDAMVPSLSPNVPNGSAAGEALVYVKTAATISGNVTSNGFTKFGPGTLTLTGASNGILGSFVVQQGTVSFGSAASTTTQMGLVLNDTGTLDLAGQNLDFGSLNNLGNTGGGIVTNNTAGTATLIINGASSGVNFTIGPAARLGTIGQNNLTITGLPTTADLYVGEPVSGTNIAAGAVIQSITNSSTIVLIANTSTNNANVTPTNQLVSFSALTGIFNGQIVDGVGKVALEKSGIGTMSIGTVNQAFTNSGNNTFTEGTTVAQGTLQVANPFGLGGYNNTTPGAVNLYGRHPRFALQRRGVERHDHLRQPVHPQRANRRRSRDQRVRTFDDQYRPHHQCLHQSARRRCGRREWRQLHPDRRIEHRSANTDHDRRGQLPPAGGRHDKSERRLRHPQPHQWRAQRDRIGRVDFGWRLGNGAG